MFRIVCDPSSGNMELYLTEIIRSLILNGWCVCVYGPTDRTHTPPVQNYTAKHRPSTRQAPAKHYE